MNEIILLSHALFGLICLLAGVWLFVDVLRIDESNLRRVRFVSRGIAVAMWVAYLIAGYWYVTSYHVDKGIILKGPWPFAHNFFMETKEHLVIMLLLLATYLPIVAANDLAANPHARKLMLWVTALTASLAFMADGMGGFIAMGVKVSLLSK